MPLPFPIVACAGVLLTGGASRRMGRDKATVVVGGVTLARRSAALLAACVDPAVELGPGVSGLRALPDAGGGPLAALAGGGPLWEGLPADGHAVVLATDLPRLTAGLLRWLAGHPSPAAVVPLDEGRPQPLCARYPVAALRDLTADAPGSARLLEWVEGLAPVLAGPEQWAGPAGDPLALRDADTPGELEALVGRASP